MGATKTEHFTKQQNQIAATAKALGHPARIAIVEYLLKVNACIGNDVLEEIPLAQPTISQHLKVLRDAHLIKGTIDGNAICYCINEDTFELLGKYLKNIAIHTIHHKCC